MTSRQVHLDFYWSLWRVSSPCLALGLTWKRGLYVLLELCYSHIELHRLPAGLLTAQNPNYLSTLLSLSELGLGRPNPVELFPVDLPALGDWNIAKAV